MPLSREIILTKIHKPRRNFEEYVFWCPGCDYSHGIKIPPWEFDGDLNNPTIGGSILAQGTYRCHSYVKNGRIQFLDDCNHKLVGQTVDLPKWPFED